MSTAAEVKRDTFAYNYSITTRCIWIKWKFTDRNDNHHPSDPILDIVIPKASFASAGDIAMVEPGEATDFVALTDAVTVVVKMPSAMGDEYLGTMPNG